MIIATAGHIDHGKTTLVTALTGVDTDRLPQEKARGISIDIGFAYWTTPAGKVVGFVDVPGHERFVGNMLAGVCGIDFALLVVAADDGVMPQTREHLNILDLLGVERGIVAITKADRVDAEHLQRTLQATRALLAGSTLRQAQLLAVSATSGQGLEALRAELAAAAAEAPRRFDAGRRLRYAVDRAFTVVGSGTVVTGTLFAGAVQVGERLQLSPSGREVRVRGIEKGGRKATRAEAGERCALNLAGIELSQVGRGDWVLHPQLHAPSTRLDVELRLLATEPRALNHNAPLRLHVGTRSAAARILLRCDGPIQPSGKAFASLVLDRPVVAAWGDRFILRDPSAQRTIGGGRVLSPHPPQRRIPSEQRMRRWQALAMPTPDDALSALAAATPEGIDAQALARDFNLDDEACARLLERAGLARVGQGAEARWLPHAVVEAAAARAKETTHAEPENPEHRRLWQLAVPVLMGAGRAGLTVEQLTIALRAKGPVLLDALHRYARAGEAVRVTDSRFYLREQITEFAEVARRAAQAGGGRFTAAAFRDGAGIGRALAVQVLEAMDRIGVTQRVGDARMLRQRPAVRAAISVDAPFPNTLQRTDLR